MGKKKSWTQRIAGKCFQLLPVIVLLGAHALADTRKPVANPDPEYPEIADFLNFVNKFNVEAVNSFYAQAGQPTAAFDPRQVQLGLKLSW